MGILANYIGDVVSNSVAAQLFLDINLIYAGKDEWTLLIAGKNYKASTKDIRKFAQKLLEQCMGEGDNGEAK